MENLNISKDFEATGVGQALRVMHGDSFSYAVAGTFEGTVKLKRSLDGGAAWETILTATAAASGTLPVVTPDQGAALYRFECSAFTSGTIETDLTEVARVLIEVKGQDGNPLIKLTEEGFSSIARIEQRSIVSAAGLAKAGTTSGWVVAAADNVALVTLPAEQTASTLVIPLPMLKVGSTIKAFNLIGQVESGGLDVVLNCSLRKQTAAAANVTDALVGSMTELTLAADAILSQANTEKSGLSEVVGEDESFYLLVTGTTAASTDVALMGAAIEVVEA